MISPCASRRGKTVVPMIIVRVKGRTGPAFPKIGKMMADLPSRSARRGKTVAPMIMVRMKGRTGPAFRKIGKMMVDLPAGRPFVAKQ